MEETLNISKKDSWFLMSIFDFSKFIVNKTFRIRSEVVFSNIWIRDDQEPRVQESTTEGVCQFQQDPEQNSKDGMGR